MQRKFTAYVLVITLLALNVFSILTLDTPSFSIDLGMLQSNMIRLYGSGDNHTQNQTDEARIYLKDQLGVTSYDGDKDGYHANVGIMLRYGILVYTHDDDNHLDYKGFGDYSRDDNGIYQHRYLGLRKDCDKDAPVTNSLYPNVTGTTTFFSTYMNKNWQEEYEGNAQSSWKIPEIEIRDYMLTDKGLAVQDSGVQIPNDSLSLTDIFKNKTGGSVEETMKYATFLAPSSLKYYGEVKGWLKVGAKPYYRTILVNPVDFKKPNLIIEFDQDQYVFAENEQTKTVTGTASLVFPYFKRIGDWKIANYIEKAYITIDGHEKKVNVIGDTITTDFSIEVDRDRFKIGKEQDFIIDGEYHLFAYEYLKGDEFVGDGVGATSVLVNPGEVEATFDIQYYKGDGQEKESVKGTTIAVESWETYRLDLVPTIEVFGENEVEDVVWVFESSQSNEVKDGTQDGMVRFIMDESKKETHLTDNKANFTMYVNLKYPFTDAEGKLTSQLVRTGWVEFIEGIPEDEVLPPQDMPPVAKLTVPDTIKQGELFKFSGGRSYDPDGEVVEYEFYGDMEIQKMYTESRGRATFLDTGEESVTERIHDNDDLSDRVKETVEVLNAVEANMRIEGYRKANRRVTLNGEQSTGSYYYPINKYIWSIEPLEGQSMDSIKYDTDNTGKYCDVLFKESGAYQITLTAKADCTFTGEEHRTSQDTVSYPIVIQPDLPPVPQLNVYSLSLRDKMDSLQATIETVDTSYSSDGDKTRTEWYYCFDSDNDGSIADETWQTFGSGQNLDGVKVDHVGDYYFYNVTTDVIPPEDTIERFLTASDYLSASSIDNALNQHCLVDNVAPVIATSAELKKTVDLLVITDETDHYTDLVSEVYRLKKELFERKISLNDQVVTYDSLSKKTIGTKITAIYKWYRQVLQRSYWMKYYYRKDRYNPTVKDYKDITNLYYMLIQTLTGSVEDSKKFPQYPNTVVQETSEGIDIYNEPGDYLKSIGVDPFIGGRYINEYNYDYYAQESVGDAYRLDNYEKIDQSPVRTYEPLMGWIQGGKISETSAEFQIGEIDAILNNYEASTNDKYLIFALENAENFYMTETQENDILQKYGFKVYFSIDALSGEFMHETPPIKQFNVDSQGLHGLTKYGNQVVNNFIINGAKSIKSYFNENTKKWVETDTTSYPVSSAGDYNYYVYKTSKLDDFITTPNSLESWGFTALEKEESPYVNDSVVYTTGKIKVSDDSLYGQLNFGGSPTYYPIWIRTYKAQMDDVPDDKKAFYLKQGYFYGARATIVGGYPLYGTGCLVAPIETNTLQYVGVGAPVTGRNMTTGNSRFSVDTGILKENVAAVYGAVMLKPRLALDNVYIYKEYDARVDDYFDVFINYNAPKAIYIVELLSGGYVLVDEGGLYSFNSLSDFRGHFDAPTYDTGYFTDYTNIEMDSEARAYFTERAALSYWGALYENSYDYNEHGEVIKNEIESIFSYSLVTKDGHLIVDGEKVAENARAGYSTGNMCVYADRNGDSWGIGYTPRGEFGLAGDFYSDFKKVFHSPYTLNATENTKDFSCIFDFVSRTPQAIRTDRGDYKTIIDAILEQYDSYRTDETILITVGDAVEMSLQALDFEGDSIMEKTVEITPVPNYFDNETGIIDVPENMDKPFVIDRPGKAEYRLRVKDNPVGNNDLFDEYRYWNKDNTVINVIAHRKPIARLTYELVPVTEGVFTFIGNYTGSYDLDHSISRADKGIVDYRYYYRTEYQGEWTEFDGTLPLERGLVYHFALQVKDLEGAWSDYDTADIEVNGELFILNGSIDPPYPTGVPAGESVTITADILTDKTMDTVTATIEGASSSVFLSKDSASGNNQVWSGTYTVPTTKVDKEYYAVDLKATASDGSTRSYPLKLNVKTPINLTGKITPYEIKKGKTGILTAQTSLYAESCNVSLFDDLYGATAQQINVSLHKDSVSGNLQNWKGTYSFDEAVPEGIYQAVFSASTANGNAATDTDTFRFIPNQPPSVSISSIKPDSATVGDKLVATIVVDDPDKTSLTLNVKVYDPDGSQILNSNKTIATSGGVYPVQYITITSDAENGIYTVSSTVTDSVGESASDTANITVSYPEADLTCTRVFDINWKHVSYPIEIENFPVNSADNSGTGIKTGYQLNFTLDQSTYSSGATYFDDNSDITIKAKITNTSGTELKTYYKTDSNSRILIDDNHTLRSFNVPGSSGVWNIEYYLPATAYFEYNSGTAYTGDILINFDISGTKTKILPTGNTIITKSFTEIESKKNDWSSNDAGYNSGDMFIYSPNSATDDFSIEESQ